MATELDHYQILGLKDRQYADSLTAQEVKKAYKRALLQHHPDKQRGDTTDLSERMGSTSATVDDVALAFKILSDPVLRAKYDRRVNDHARQSSLRLAGHHTGMETVDLDELDFDEKSGTWLRSCRCGSVPAFVVTEAELETNVEDGELVVGCKGCSLWLKVLFSDDG